MQGEESSLVVTHEQFAVLGSDDITCQSAYRELFRYHPYPGIVDEIRAATKVIMLRGVLAL
jgi:hypothetical protein